MTEQPESGSPVAAEEVGAVLEELRRVRDEPPPSESTSGGCALAIVAIVAIVLMPFIGRGFDLSGGVMAALGAALLLIALTGGLVGLLGGGRPGDLVAREVDRAIGELRAARAEGDEERSRAAAVRLLERVSAAADAASTGAASPAVARLDRAALLTRLGEARVYTERVERILRAEGEIGPVLTGGDGSSGPEDR